MYVDTVSVHGKRSKTVRAMLMGKPQMLLGIGVAPSGNDVVLQRMFRTVQEAFSSNKVFSYGGSQQDRNNCIGILQRDHLAYYANLRHKSHIKIADTFSKTKLATSLALYSSAPAFRPCHQWKKST